MMETAAQIVQAGQGILGLELGSTRIKAVLIGPDHTPIASGSHQWENRLEDGLWTYHLEDVWSGIQDAYRDLKEDVKKTCGVPLKALKALGFSAMMHGYLAFDKNGGLLVPFRTWRNTNTAAAADKLTALFGFNIPQRWSVAHLYQAMLNGEAHVADLDFCTTLAGYVHWKLTGEKVLGVGDAAGMFPVDSATMDYDAEMLQKFDGLTGDYAWRLHDLLPKVLPAGAAAGVLTAEGAALLDPTGELAAGAPLCPPEGDAGTGMAATCSVEKRTGNVSAGTSVFAMVVLEKGLSRVYPEIDMVTTPTGAPVAMVHCNNCTSDINAWANLLSGFATAAGAKINMDAVYAALFHGAMQGDADCGGLVNLSFLSGEPIVRLEEGRPLFVRTPDANFTFDNFARTQLFGAMATLKQGMDLLAGENVQIDRLTGHGGFFKTPGTAQNLMASALSIPVTTMETAGEGGPWGMALLAAYLVDRDGEEPLAQYLENKVFAHSRGVTAQPDAKDTAGFNAYMTRFSAALDAERAAVETLH